ncbi:Uncharacterized response regulatory protein SA0215 [uncultured Ruminococcus sp.]|uniref:Stage 0 sporulation protein A homolog n=1 Tax=Massiliimalia timonensis TaxID=1987501 RepID=A0A8J6PFH0_9FIRM|nr:AraC family transcriptional regulator [Massiliimalia timonensis]MBC8610757.1 response regulator [Massiliimalia timonensis]SCH95605.1 Uncharacterized response regulatory protein SA0215 [uncultured Clostridium sp.]SCI28524.1 Uncharacterized response regulatory protein SA0215 [uncultured Ruminococcus sp.]
MLKVMIVDDEKPIRQWFEFILRDIPDMDIHIIGSYPNGQVALKACETELPDVIFCDIIMPVMNGIELIRQAKERYPSVEVLILSNFGDFDYVYQGLRYGAFDYLLKAKSDDSDIVRVMHELQDKLQERRRLENSGASDQEEYSHGVVNQLIQYIRENYDKPIRLSSLAQKFNYHPDYLSQIFKQYTGKTFGAYLTDIRIEQAKYLMDHGVSRVKDIAAMVGYSNEMYFSTAFKKSTGMSPTNYLHRLKEEI